AGWAGRRAYLTQGDNEVVTSESGRLALLVMGDASARRTEKAPGYIDDRAAPYDAEVAAAFASGPTAVARLDGRLADELLVAGWPAWQLLARVSRDAEWDAQVTYDEAPYGV